MTDAMIANDGGGMGNKRTLTFDPETGRLEAETYMDGEGHCCIAFDLSTVQRHRLANLLLTGRDAT